MKKEIHRSISAEKHGLPLLTLGRTFRAGSAAAPQFPVSSALLLPGVHLSSTESAEDPAGWALHTQLQGEFPLSLKHPLEPLSI